MTDQVESEAVHDALDEYIDRYSNWGRWGGDDQCGTTNHITPALVRAAAGLVRTGQVVPLGLHFDQNGPQTGANGRFNCLRYSVATGTDHALSKQMWAGGPLPRQMGYADDTGRAAPAVGDPLGQPVATSSTAAGCTTATRRTSTRPTAPPATARRC